MSRRKSSKQLKNMIIAMIVLIVLILIAFLVFIFNVDVNKNGSGLKDFVSSNKNNKEEAVIDGVIAPDELVGAEYESVSYDRENTFEVVTINEKVYFNVLDEERFNSKYSNSKLEENSKKEVATHDYKVNEVYVQICAGREYLLVTMEDGNIGIMDIEEAVNENVFRIKKELITLNKPVSRIYSTYRTFNDEVQESTVLVSSNGQMYDLQKFVE